jgi:hypothetical protein
VHDGEQPRSPNFLIHERLADNTTKAGNRRWEHINFAVGGGHPAGSAVPDAGGTTSLTAPDSFDIGRASAYSLQSLTVMDTGFDGG